MKKKLVLFALILGLLLPVFGAKVSATRTKDEWHETDAAAVKKIEDAGYSQDVKDLQDLLDSIANGQKAIDDWEKAIDVKEGMSADVNEAEKAVKDAKNVLDEKTTANEEAKTAFENAVKALNELLAEDAPSDDEVKEAQDARDEAYANYEKALADYQQALDAYKPIHERSLEKQNNFEVEAKQIAQVEFGSEDYQVLLRGLKYNAEFLGFALDEDLDANPPMDQLEAAKGDVESQTEGEQLLKKEAAALENVTKTQAAYDGSKTELETAEKDLADTLDKRDNREALIAEAEKNRDEAKAAYEEAKAAQKNAEATLTKAENVLEGARAKLAGASEESANSKLEAANNSAKKEFGERLASIPWSTEYAKELLSKRVEEKDKFINNPEYQARKAAYDRAVFEADNRPATISGLTAVANNDGTITLSWDEVDADNIVIFYLGTDGETSEVLFELPGDTTTVVHENPVLNATNFYTAIAVDEVDIQYGKISFPGYQTEKDVDEIGWAYAYAKITDRPADVTGLRAVTDKDGYVTVSWDKSEGADYYRLFSLGTDGKSQKVIYEGPATTFQDKKAVATIDDELVWNFYTVNAVKVKIDKDKTRTEFLSAKTNPAYTYAWADGSLRGQEKPEVGELEAIKNMTATTNADGTITVTWSEDPNAFYYIVVYISRTDANGENNINVQNWKSVSGDTSATFDELAEGYHFFRVYGVNKIDGKYRQSPPADPNYTFSFTAGTEIAD